MDRNTLIGTLGTFITVCFLMFGLEAMGELNDTLMANILTMAGTVISLMFLQRHTDKAVANVDQNVTEVKREMETVRDEVTNGTMTAKVKEAVTIALDEHGSE